MAKLKRRWGSYCQFAGRASPPKEHFCYSNQKGDIPATFPFHKSFDLFLENLRLFAWFLVAPTKLNAPIVKWVLCTVGRRLTTVYQIAIDGKTSHFSVSPSFSDSTWTQKLRKCFLFSCWCVYFFFVSLSLSHFSRLGNR